MTLWERLEPNITPLLLGNQSLEGQECLQDCKIELILNFEARLYCIHSLATRCAKDQFRHCGNHHWTTYKALQKSSFTFAVSTQCHGAHCIISADGCSPWWFLLKVVIRSESSLMTQVETEVGWWPVFLF